MLKNFILTYYLFSCCVSFAQQNYSSNDVNIHCDERINQLVELEKRIDQIQGYRIQICFDSDKNKADRARGKFLKLFPLTDTYMAFENPHFNLKVGDYRSKMEAEKIKRQIFGEFVISIIHEELVNLPRID